MHLTQARMEWWLEVGLPRCHFILPRCEGGELAGLPAASRHSGALPGGYRAAAFELGLHTEAQHCPAGDPASRWPGSPVPGVPMRSGS
jgi:hypothetical protein